MIPARWFLTLLATLPHLDARRALEGAQQVAHGAALAMNGKDAGVKRLTTDLQRAATPLVYDPADETDPEETPADG